MKGEPTFECHWTLSDDRYEIIGDNCFHFALASRKTYQDAQTYCATIFPKSKGKVYEPRSLFHLESIKKVWKRKRAVINHNKPYDGTNNANNCFFLGIDDTLNEGTYIYPSDGTSVDPDVKSKISPANGCNQSGLTHSSSGSNDCDYVYTCESSPAIYTVYPNPKSFLCEHVTE